MSWNAIVELEAHELTERDITRIMEMLETYHAAVGTSVLGRPEIVVTYPAEGFAQAVRTAMLLAGSIPFQPTSLNVLLTDDFDRLNNLEPVPELLSVTQTAGSLGVSRQRVLGMIKSGTLHPVKVGNAWALTRREIDAVSQSRR